MKRGDIVRMTSFTHHEPNMSVSFKAPKGKVAVFILLGEENKDGTDPMDCMNVMHEMGWVPDKIKTRKKK